jgi:tetratricopeptide (TPR) repeat protein
LVTKGFLLANKQNYQEAIEMYKKSIQFKREQIGGYLRMADAYFQLKDYNNSINTLDSGLKYNPNDFLLLNNKGYTLYVMGKYTEAIENLKSSLKIKPDYTTASVNLSKLSPGHQ